MNILTKTSQLREFCQRAAQEPYVTVDTEFHRERTYYSKLCLIQLAMPGEGDEGAVIVDPLSADLDLDPLYTLFSDPSVVKVFHAARQDLEIFFVDRGVIPAPLFDTQVAAMVCGFGDQVGYETLVRKLADSALDKSSRFTDWSQRPLSPAQLKYALGDVTHLRVIYEELSRSLEETGRQEWVGEELGALTEPGTYRVEPDEAWRRIKTRSNSARFMCVVAALARFREERAQTRNVPRSRIFKDDALLELASTKPKNHENLSKSRLLLREARKGEIADGILNAVAEGMKADPSAFETSREDNRRINPNPAIAEMLRVFLKARAEATNVAQRLIATSAELDAMAAGERDLRALRGWRSDVFGAEALRLCEGEMGLRVQGRKIATVEL